MVVYNLNNDTVWTAKAQMKVWAFLFYSGSFVFDL